MTPWGKSKNGKKRYGCNYCKTTRLYKKSKGVDILKLFKRYILWGLTYEMLSDMSGLSVRYLEGEFHKLLKLDPPVFPRFDQSGFTEAYLLIDGLWFGRWFVLILYRQSKTLYLLHISVAGREAQTKIVKDLKFIKDNLKYNFTGAVTDGGTAIVSAVNEVYPHMAHQICLAHMHRDIINATGRYSKDSRVQELIDLANHVWLIESLEALNWWKDKLKDWVTKNLSFIRETRKDDTGRIWFVHKGVRKALGIMIKLPKTSFKFLKHPTMPKTTNEIEATFGHMGQRWIRHKGLKRDRWESFLKWFSYYYNKKIIEEMKTDNFTKED